MPLGKAPLSPSPAAARKRRQRERDGLAAQLAELGVKLPTAISISSSSSRSAAPAPAPAPARAAANDNLPMHETTPIEGAGADAYAGPTELPPRTEGAQPVPIVPESKQSIGADGQPVAGERPPVSPEEAKALAAMVVGYFQFGSRMLFEKHPEFLEGLVAMAGSPEAFQGGYAFACQLVGKCSEACALKYNVHLPYVEEAVVLGAIGVATFGFAGKPSKRGEQARVGKAKDANPSSASSSSSSSSSSSVGAPADIDGQPRSSASGKLDPDAHLWSST